MEDYHQSSLRTTESYGERRLLDWCAETNHCIPYKYRLAS